MRKKLGVGRCSLGSLSESVSVFDPEPLQQIAAELAHEVPSAGAGKFDAVGQQLTPVDGSVIDTVVRVAQLAWLPKAKGNWLSAYRLHTHFEVLRGVPARIDVTPANPKGEYDERAVLEKTIEPDRCYVTDRGYAKFAPFNAVVAAGSSYVCRVRDNSTYEIQEIRELTEADRTAGVLSDEIVLLGKGRKADERPDHLVRIITVAASPHTSRGKYRGGSTGPSCDGKLRIATNRLDLPAELISEIYRLRWLIELFFSDVQAALGLPPSVEYQTERRRNPGVLRDHCLPANSDSHRPHSNQANIRDDLLLPLRLGQPRRIGAAHRKTAADQVTAPPRVKRDASRCADRTPWPPFHSSVSAPCSNKRSTHTTLPPSTRWC